MAKSKHQSLEHRIAALIEAEGLPPEFGRTVERFYVPLARHLADVRHEQVSTTLVVGINGGQGSGKSTLALFLKLLLESGHGLKTVVISLDDLYLTRAERAALALECHPLLATRGVPGTHDIGLGMRLLDQLTSGGSGAVRLPHFDKAQDDRAPEADWSVVSGPVDIILLEGWCVGACAQVTADLDAPVNNLETDEDPDGVWRDHVNAQLAGQYAAFFARLDHLIMLKVPDFDCVQAFRSLQEAKLRAKVGQGQGGGSGPVAGLMDEGAIGRFIMHYERLTRHMLAEMPSRADVVMELDREQKIECVNYR